MAISSLRQNYGHFWVSETGLAYQPVSCISDTVEDERAVNEKQGVSWECIGRSFVRDGYIYHYRPRENAKQVIAKVKEAFPAIESSVNSISTLDQSLNKFGYSYSTNRLDLPDRDFLQARLKEFYPEFTETIVSSEGIADDLSYVKAFLKYFILISDGKEFVHDHTVHAIPMLKMLVDDPVQLLSAMKNWRALINDVLKMVESATILKINHELKGRIMKMVGALVDSLWSNMYTKTPVWTIDEFIYRLPMVWHIDAYQYYWKRVYGEEIDYFRARALLDSAFLIARL